MSGGDSDSTSLLLGGLVDHVVVHDLTVSGSLSENFGDSSGEGSLSVTVEARKRKSAKSLDSRGKAGLTRHDR